MCRVRSIFPMSVACSQNTDTQRVPTPFGIKTVPTTPLAHGASAQWPRALFYIGRALSRKDLGPFGVILLQNNWPTSAQCHEPYTPTPFQRLRENLEKNVNQEAHQLFATSLARTCKLVLASGDLWPKRWFSRHEQGKTANGKYIIPHILSAGFLFLLGMSSPPPPLPPPPPPPLLLPSSFLLLLPPPDRPRKPIPNDK